MFRSGFDAEARKQQARQAQKANFKKQLDEQMTELDARKRAERMEKVPLALRPLPFAF